MIPEQFTPLGGQKDALSIVVENTAGALTASEWHELVKNLRYAIDEHHCLGGVLFSGGSDSWAREPKHAGVLWVPPDHLTELFQRIKTEKAKYSSATMVVVWEGEEEKL